MEEPRKKDKKIDRQAQVKLAWNLELTLHHTITGEEVSLAPTKAMDQREK